MEDKEFDIILEAFKRHFKKEKTFVPNSERIAEVKHAFDIANELFPDHVTEIQNDPLQTGALILCVDCTAAHESMVLTGEREISLFNSMVSKANNFEFYQYGEHIRFAAVFNGALELIE